MTNNLKYQFGDLVKFRFTKDSIDQKKEYIGRFGKIIETQYRGAIPVYVTSFCRHWIFWESELQPYDVNINCRNKKV
jgi:hypothetical protein